METGKFVVKKVSRSEVNLILFTILAISDDGSHERESYLCFSLF